MRKIAESDTHQTNIEPCRVSLSPPVPSAYATNLGSDPLLSRKAPIYCRMRMDYTARKVAVNCSDGHTYSCRTASWSVYLGGVCGFPGLCRSRVSEMDW